MLLLIFSVVLQMARSQEDWACSHEIFCKPGEGGILHQVQMNEIFNDSKTFVDMPLKFSKEEVISNFKNLTDDSSKEILQKFVSENFSEEGTELEEYTPLDWQAMPDFIETLQDDGLKKLAIEMNSIWKNLTRRISKSESEINAKSSLIYLEKPFVVPGGRFREVYYWDSYWTVKGLLLCKMFETTKGMIENFNHLIDVYGHIPNGNRLYYTARSQPPVFALMVWDYINSTNDPTTERQFIASIIWSLDKEFQFWEARMVSVSRGNVTHKLARYWVDVGGPRPESYLEDYRLAQNMNHNESSQWFRHMKSGAESGWDYSSRWFNNNNNNNNNSLSSVSTGDILPVDLNSFLCKNAEILAELFRRMERPDMATKYEIIRENLKVAIRSVLYDEEDKIWYDYNHVTETKNRNFYPSNLSPLYTMSHHDDLDLNASVAKWSRLEAFNYSGGVPASLERSGEQWDFPNVWPPLVEMVVTALENSGTAGGLGLARLTAQSFVTNVHSGWLSSGAVYEKYSCEEGGGAGQGGEYEVQTGFGWTNGVTLSLLAKYPDMVSSASSLPGLATSVVMTVVSALASSRV